MIRQTRLRSAAIGTATLLGLGGLAACGGESAGPEAGAVTTSDLQQLEEQIGALDERVGVLEEEGVGAGVGDGAGVGAGDGGAGLFEDESGVFTDSQSLIGQEVTVSAEVSELFTTTGTGSAFRIAGEGDGQEIAVVSTGQTAPVDANDVVRVSGVVQQVSQDTFEEDFGVAADELFEDPEGFFADEEGSPAIAADGIEVLQEAGGE